MLELVEFCIIPSNFLSTALNFFARILFQLIDFLSNTHLSLVNLIVRPIKLVVDIILDGINQVLGLIFLG
jgi:hypothetical protein